MTRLDSRLAAALAAVGAFAVGGAIQVKDGYGAPAAFVWLTVAVVAVLAAVAVPTHRRSRRCSGARCPRSWSPCWSSSSSRW